MTTDAPLYGVVLRAFRSWHKPQEPQHLLSHLKLVQQRRLDSRLANASLREATNDVLREALRNLKQKDSSLAELLERRFVHRLSARQVALEDNSSIETLFRRQREALKSIALWLSNQEELMTRLQASAWEMRLPASSYSALFGTVHLEQLLTQRLLDTTANGLTAVTGLGGIGKTALVDKVVRRLPDTHHYTGNFWLHYAAPTLTGVSSTPEAAFVQLMLKLAELDDIGAQGLPLSMRNTRIWQFLREQPYLIVIDNIEEEMVAARLWTELARYAGPTHFVVTSRVQTVSSVPVFSISLPELLADDSLRLIRHIAQQSNLPAVAAADDRQLRPIVDIVGGNPLALKLAVGLARTMPVEELVRELEHGYTRQVGELYRYIYRRSWETLRPESQKLLKAMCAISESGGSIAQMQHVSALSDALFWDAVQELTGRSLLEVRGAAGERRYGIHRLTTTFLRTDILGL